MKRLPRLSFGWPKKIWTIKFVYRRGKPYGEVQLIKRRMIIKTKYSLHFVLDTTIHEGLHAICDYLSEDSIRYIAPQLTKLILLLLKEMAKNADEDMLLKIIRKLKETG